VVRLRVTSSPFPTFNKEFRKFESLDIWKQLKDSHGNSLLPWYFGVSINRMPAKYLISKSIACNITDLRLASEEELWEEHRNIIETFLETWKGVKSGEVDIISDLAWQKISLMDLNVELVKRMLTHCNFCRWNCQVDRSVQTDRAGETKKHGTCQLESTSKVSNYFHHRGEELVFRGIMGSGTIFFTSTIVQAISMLDSFKIPDINKNKEEDLNYIKAVKADKYNNNYFSTWHMNSEYAFYQKQLFNSPQLWNSNFFMSKETMCILRSLMDAWLPDFKFGPGKCALDLSRTPWYWDTVTNNLRLIHEWGEDFVIRHLIMPNHVECCTKPVLDWIATNMPEVPINIMDQYYPDNLCDPSSPKYRERYSEIARSPTEEEIIRSYQYAKDLGLNFETLSCEKSVFGLNI
jgi:putative pyruvate formate lyase activating enzyme